MSDYPYSLKPGLIRSDTIDKISNRLWTARLWSEEDQKWSVNPAPNSIPRAGEIFHGVYVESASYSQSSENSLVYIYSRAATQAEIDEAAAKKIPLRYLRHKLCRTQCGYI